MEKDPDKDPPGPPFSQEIWGRWIRWSFALYWFCEALFLWHPFAQKTIALHAARLGLSSRWSYLYCGLAVGFGAWNLWGRMRLAPLLIQSMVLLLPTVLLAINEPMLLVHPLGVFTKTLPLLVLSWWLARDLTSTEPSVRDIRALRVGMAAIWWTEGLFPKILFQQKLELDMVHASGLFFVEPSVFLVALGSAQIVAGIAVLLLWGRWLRWLLTLQVVALCILPLMVIAIYPAQLFYPTGPLTKTFPLAVGTYLVLRLCQERQEACQ